MAARAPARVTKPEGPVLPQIYRALEWTDIGINVSSGARTATTQFKVALGFTQEARAEMDNCVLVVTGASERWTREGIEKILRDATNDLLTVINNPNAVGAAVSAQIGLAEAQRRFIGVDVIPLPPPREVEWRADLWS